MKEYITYIFLHIRYRLPGLLNSLGDLLNFQSELTNKVKLIFFQATVVSILVYGCTTWTPPKRMEKKLDSNYTRMLLAILNKSWRQHFTKQQLYGHLAPITKIIKVRRTRHASHCWRSKDELISDIILWTLHIDKQRQNDQSEPIYNSSVSIQDIALKTSQEQWTIETGGERGQGRSVMTARQDDAWILVHMAGTKFPSLECSTHGRWGGGHTHTHIYIYIYIWFRELLSNINNSILY